MNNRHSLPDRVLAQGNPFNVTPGGQVGCFFDIVFGVVVVLFSRLFSKVGVYLCSPTELAKASLRGSWRVDLTSRWNGEMMTMRKSYSHHDRVMMTMVTSSSHHDGIIMTMMTE